MVGRLDKYIVVEDVSKVFEVKEQSFMISDESVPTFGVASNFLNLILRIFGAGGGTVIRALDNVSFKVERNEILGVLGPNGSGKTTLLKIVAGLLLPSSGEVYVMDHSVEGEAERVRSLVSYIPGSLVGGAWVNPLLSARDNLKLIFSLLGIPRSRVDEALRLVGLEKYADVKVGNFSSGMAARLQICYALMRETPIYLFDEPTAGISAEAVNVIHDFIVRELHEGRGSVIVYSTNNVVEAEKICDRIIILDRGRVVADGDVGSLLHGIGAYESVIMELQGVNRPGAMLEDLGIRYVHVAERPGICKVRFLCDDSRSIIPELIDRVVKGGGGKIRFLNVTSPSLEDVFLYYVGGGSVE